METLQAFVEVGVFAFMLTFVRVGTAMFLMPGIGDTYTPQKVRLYFTLGLALTLAPIVQSHLPETIPPTFAMLGLLLSEFLIGAFIGMISRILMMALDTAGMMISMQAGLANAQLFNPAFASQGSIFGAFMLLSGMMLIFATDLHHLFILGIMNSYEGFPIGEIPEKGSLAQIVAQAVSASFDIGIRISAPFIVVTTVLYIGMGVMARLMPQVQIFMIAIPAQIMIALVLMSLTMSAGLMFWLSFYEQGMYFFFSGGG